MEAVERILVPLDGSPVSEAVIPLAETLARDYGAELVMLRAVHLGGFEALDPEADVDLTGEAESYLLRVAGELQARNVTGVRWRVAHGKPDRAIAEAASSDRVDLIAMATHGRGGLARLLLGSVAESVVREAPTPVLLIRGQPSWAAGSLGRILVPLDGSQRSESVLTVVERLAGPLDYTIHLLHVIEPLPSHVMMMETAPRLEEIIRERKAMADDYLLKIAGPLEAKGLRVRGAVGNGPVPEVIPDYAREEGIGLIAMTTHGRTGLERALLGSVAERILRGATVPVLLWKAGAE